MFSDFAETKLWIASSILKSFYFRQIFSTVKTLWHVMCFFIFNLSDSALYKFFWKKAMNA